jgi:iron complex transport system substrate-binding protein
VRERADEVVAGLRARIAALEEGAGARRGTRVLGYSNYGMGGLASGEGTTMDLMARLAGLRNAAAEAGIEGYRNVDFEDLLSLDPDVLVVGAQGDGFQGSPTVDVLRGEPVLANLRAVRDERIVVMPSHLFATNSHHLVDAAEELARRIDALLAGGE